MSYDLRNGKGLKVLNRRERWYGGGYCGICGHTGDDLVPRAVRYWDCDDGWKAGVLCSYCLDECRDRGPEPGDYAYRGEEDTRTRTDVLATYADLDACYADTLDRER